MSQKKESETYLPTNEYLEFLGDLKDSIQLHKDKLMIKMSSYLAEKLSQEKDKII